LKNKEIFYISNLLSLSRFVLLIFIMIFLLSNSGFHYLITSLLILILWLTDILDGYFARKRNEVSELGRIIDPLADKTAVVAITIILVTQNIIPMWFFIIIALRDVLILTGGAYIKHIKGIVLQSNRIGKLTVFIIGFTLLNSILLAYFTVNTENNFILYHIDKLELYWKFLILVSIVMSVISIVSYFRKFLKTISS
jgi:cardiolipin synthase